MKRALVLSGGGAKGAYQIGVWKALNKLGKKIDIVTGTSIGSINAAMFAQKKYFKSKYLWLNLKTSDLFDYDTTKSVIENKNNIETMILNKGLSNEKMTKYLNGLINEDKVRKSKIKYGLVTYNLKTKSPRCLSIDEIPRGKLVDYVIASSTCFPAIEKKEIDGEYYIDGGFYDNMPINLAVDMGADEVIAVDLSVLAFNQKVKEKDIKIDLIKMRDKKLFTLDFSRKNAERLIALGYFDTLKYYNKLEGNIYTFKRGSLLKNYNNIKEYYVDLLNYILLTKHSNALMRQIFKISKYNKIFYDLKQGKSIEKIINDSMEYLGKIFNINDTKLYSNNSFNKVLLSKVCELNYVNDSKNLKGKMLVSYIYNKYMNSNDREKEVKELFNMALIFQKDFLAALYLISISKKYTLYLKSKEEYMELYKNAYDVK